MTDLVADDIRWYLAVSCAENASGRVNRTRPSEEKLAELELDIGILACLEVNRYPSVSGERAPRQSLQSAKGVAELDARSCWLMRALERVFVIVHLEERGGAKHRTCTFHLLDSQQARDQGLLDTHRPHL